MDAFWAWLKGMLFFKRNIKDTVLEYLPTYGSFAREKIKAAAD